MSRDDDATKRLEEIRSLFTLLQDDEFATVIFSFLTGKDLSVFNSGRRNTLATPEIDFCGSGTSKTPEDVMADV